MTLSGATHVMTDRARSILLAGLFALPVTAPAMANDAVAIHALLCGRTLHYFNPDLGNQIEYTAVDGTAWLWHSDFDKPIRGTWTVTEIDDTVGEVCYVYDPGSFGPDDFGSQFCFDYGALIVDIQPDGVRDGDPYNLSSGAIPFALPPLTPVSVPDLVAQFPDLPPEPACGAMMM